MAAFVVSHPNEVPVCMLGEPAQIHCANDAPIFQPRLHIATLYLFMKLHNIVSITELILPPARASLKSKTLVTCYTQVPYRVLPESVDIIVSPAAVIRVVTQRFSGVSGEEHCVTTLITNAKE